MVTFQITEKGDNALTRAAALHEPSMRNKFDGDGCEALQLLLYHGADPRVTPRLGESSTSCLDAITYWTQLDPCPCVPILQKHSHVNNNVTRSPTKQRLVGNRAIGTHKATKVKQIVNQQELDIWTVDHLGHSTISYLLMTSRSKQCIENVKALLDQGCTVRNGEGIASALMHTGTGRYGENKCFPSLGVFMDNEWIFPANRYDRYQQILTLLGAAGMDPIYLDKVEAFITEDYDPHKPDPFTLRGGSDSDSDSSDSQNNNDNGAQNEPTKDEQVIHKQRRYVDVCEYDMSGTSSVPSLQRFSRAAIRKTLVKHNPQTNLFRLVPILPLPTVIKKYLLYQVILHPYFRIYGSIL